MFLLCQVVKDTEQYCTDHKIPFPKIDFSKYESQPKKEVYVFTDEKNPDAPIVLHFPLVNVSFKEYKAPGECALFTCFPYLRCKSVVILFVACG